MPRQVYGDGDLVYLDHDGIVHKTDRAILFDIHGEQQWIPKSIIEDMNDEIVGVKKWWAEKNGIRGDW